MQFKTFNRIWNIAFAVIHDHQMFDSCKRWQEWCDQTKKRTINKYDFIFGMVGDVRQLFWKQSNVERMRNTTCAWWRKVQLKMARGVPCKCCNATVFANAQLVEHSA